MSEALSSDMVRGLFCFVEISN